MFSVYTLTPQCCLVCQATLIQSYTQTDVCIQNVQSISFLFLIKINISSLVWFADITQQEKSQKQSYLWAVIPYFGSLGYCPEVGVFQCFSV